ncbi:unnamed protein product, partial [Urochloa humidicola]
ALKRDLRHPPIKQQREATRPLAQLADGAQVPILLHGGVQAPLPWPTRAPPWLRLRRSAAADPLLLCGGSAPSSSSGPAALPPSSANKLRWPPLPLASTSNGGLPCLLDGQGRLLLLHPPRASKIALACLLNQ